METTCSNCAAFAARLEAAEREVDQLRQKLLRRGSRRAPGGDDEKGRLVEAACARHGLTMKELADKLGVSQSRLSPSGKIPVVRREYVLKMLREMVQETFMITVAVGPECTKHEGQVIGKLRVGGRTHVIGMVIGEDATEALARWTKTIPPAMHPSVVGMQIEAIPARMLPGEPLTGRTFTDFGNEVWAYQDIWHRISAWQAEHAAERATEPHACGAGTCP